MYAIRSYYVRRACGEYDRRELRLVAQLRQEDGPERDRHRLPVHADALAGSRSSDQPRAAAHATGHSRVPITKAA